MKKPAQQRKETKPAEKERPEEQKEQVEQPEETPKCPRLICLSQPLRNHRYYFKDDDEITEVTIGRSDDCDFVLYEASVSSKHCIARKISPHHIEIVDPGSTNGTFVNGIRLDPGQPCILHTGDILRIAHIEILFEDECDPHHDEGNHNHTVVDLENTTPMLLTDHPQNLSPFHRDRLDDSKENKAFITVLAILAVCAVLAMGYLFFSLIT